MGGAALEVEGLEFSRFHQALVGVDIPVHYEWACFSVEPLAEKLTSLNDLRRVAAGITERIQIASSRGFTCSMCKTAGGVDREQVTAVDFSRGDMVLDTITWHRPIELPVCSLCQTRHCRACANECSARRAAADAADARARETQKLNEEAQCKKQQRKRGALQPMRAVPDPRVTEAADAVLAVAAPLEPLEPSLSKSAQRRRDKQAKQRQAALRLENKAAEKEEEENRKLRKQVERLKLTENTTLQQSNEASELENILPKDSQKKRVRPAQPPLAAELEQRLLTSSQRGTQMRAEVTSFVAAYSGLAPADGCAFGEHLVETLLGGKPCDNTYDKVAAATVFGDFADAFCSHDWREPRLRVGRHVVISAAAAVEQSV